MTSIFIPGQGTVPFGVARISAALRDYDKRLFFAQHKDTNDWCVFVEMPRGKDPFPVVGWPDGHVPHVDEVMDRIKRGDTLRNGDRMFNEAVKSQHEHKARLDKAASEASEMAAERAEFEMRKRGLSPVVKVFMNGGDTSDS